MRKLQAAAAFVSKAAPEDIYPLLKNSASYPFWSMIEYFELIKPGRDELHGVGAQRIFKTGRNVMREEIVQLMPNRLVAYTLLSGFPMLDYRAEALLERLPPGGTRITWRCSFYPRYWGTGWFWRLVMQVVLRSFVRALARAAQDPRRREEILAAGRGNSTSKGMSPSKQGSGS
jgi:hypothetical protein